MYTVIVLIRIWPEKLREFQTLAREHARLSRHEQHCLSFKVLQDVDDIYQFSLLETFSDKAAYLDHKTTQHYATWREEIVTMQAEPRIHAEFVEL
jgi:quinol monooxygenase YgiN